MVNWYTPKKQYSKQKPNQIRVKVEKTNTGFSAFATRYPVYTTGADIEEVRNNMVESINLLFEEDNREPITATDIYLVSVANKRLQVEAPKPKKKPCPLCGGTGKRIDAHTKEKRNCVACLSTGRISCI